MEGPHQHLPRQPSHGRAFALGVSLNLGFVMIEAWYGWQTDSLALLADAGHNLGDVGGLVLAWVAWGASRLRADKRHTYGWRRGSILAGFANAVLLLVAMGSLAWEALHRLGESNAVDAGVVMLVAGIGVLVNTGTAWLFWAGSHRDLNIRGAFLHMATDALVSVGVVAAGALYLWKGWAWIDPATSLLVAAVVVIGTWSLLRQSLHLLFDGVPEGIDVDELRGALEDLQGVDSVHDLHVWAMSTSDTALTAHLVVDAEASEGDALLERATSCVANRFGIRHVAFQRETAAYASSCPLAGPDRHD